MKKHLLLLTLVVFSTSIVLAQPQKAKPKESQSALKKILSGTGLPYKIINDSFAIIPYGGENIESYEVVIQMNSSLFIVYTNLSEILPGKLVESRFKYLLERNNDFDKIKIGLAEDGSFFLRADEYRSSTTSIQLKRVISQVGNVTNIIAGELK